MRKINSLDFHVARRSTSRDVNRQIVLNLVREHQPISRADLARLTDISRGGITVLISELVTEGLIYEQGIGEASRGRKPTFLHLNTQNRLIIAIDIRLSQTYLMLSDFSGRQIALETWRTILIPDDLVRDLSKRIRTMLRKHQASSLCQGIGIAVPGIVDHRTGRILNAPTLGWREIDLRDALSAATGLPVQIENAAKACALAQMWLGPDNTVSPHDFVYVSVSDGVGVGIVFNGELVRGRDSIAGEFGHVPLNIEGPRCLCGSIGCLEAYVSNLATISRYQGLNLSTIDPRQIMSDDTNLSSINKLLDDVVAGQAEAIQTIQTTARYLGLGIATIINTLNPARIYIGGEIVRAWEIIEPQLRATLIERVMTEAGAHTPIQITNVGEYPRLRGAAALIAAPTFAAPRVA